MEIFVALFAAASIVLTIRVMVLLRQANKAMDEIPTIIREVRDLSAKFKEMNDAMLAARGYGAGGGNSHAAGTMIQVDGGGDGIHGVGGFGRGEWGATPLPVRFG